MTQIAKKFPGGYWEKLIIRGLQNLLRRTPVPGAMLAGEGKTSLAIRKRNFERSRRRSQSRRRSAHTCDPSANHKEIATDA